MRIVYLAAGAAGMYCGSCLHDNTLAGALRSRGDDILLAPTYTPLKVDEPDSSAPPLHYGGINVFLQQWFPPIRWLPSWADSWLDSSRVMGWVSKINFPVRAEKLGGLTLSMLRGEAGFQRKELDNLVRWLADEVKPDLVHLSNSMLSGVTREITTRLNIPVVCTLSGEDLFIERLPPLWYGRVREELRRRAEEVSKFVAFNTYYSEFMSDYLHVDRSRIAVIPHGLKLEGHGTRQTSNTGEFVIGYLARIAPEKGLHLLVEAFKLLAADASLPRMRLRVAGYLNAAERAYFDELQSRAASWGLGDRFEYVGEVSREKKIEFLQSLDVMSVPTVYREAKGLSVLEAMANAVPVVVPAHGTFPELIEDTGGGLLCEPNDPQDLARVLRQLAEDRSLVEYYGRRGQQAVRDRYHAALMADRHHTLYEEVIDEYRRRVPPVAPSDSPETSATNAGADVADAVKP